MTNTLTDRMKKYAELNKAYEYAQSPVMRPNMEGKDWDFKDQERRQNAIFPFWSEAPAMYADLQAAVEDLRIAVKALESIEMVRGEDDYTINEICVDALNNLAKYKEA